MSRKIAGARSRCRPGLALTMSRVTCREPLPPRYGNGCACARVEPSETGAQLLAPDENLRRIDGDAHAPAGAVPAQHGAALLSESRILHPHQDAGDPSQEHGIIGVWFSRGRWAFESQRGHRNRRCWGRGWAIRHIALGVASLFFFRDAHCEKKRSNAR